MTALAPVGQPWRMTAPAPLHGGFAEPEMYDIAERACSAVGLDGSVAGILRGHSNAVLLLKHAPVVVKIARSGTRQDGVARTVQFVHWLMKRDFPTVPLHPLPRAQPVVVDGIPVTFWTYLPQPDRPVGPGQLASLLSQLHGLPRPPLQLPGLDHVAAIRSSLSSVTILPTASLDYLAKQADRLESDLRTVRYALPEAVVQGDPQHRNALHDGDGAVLCDWDTVALGRPEWDLVTIEIHCRRFGYGADHYEEFVRTYGFDVTELPGYRTLRDIRELRMITTNARKAAYAPHTITEVERRVEGIRKAAHTLSWNIL